MKKKLLIIGGIALVVIIAIVLVICLTGGRGGNNAMVGTWEGTVGVMMNSSEEYNFKADGTYTYTLVVYYSTSTRNGTYTYENNTVTIDGVPHTVKDNSFTEGLITFVKK